MEYIGQVEIESTMQILLNGRSHELQDGATVAALLESLNLRQRRVAVEVNQHIIPRSEHDITPLRPDDQVEVVHAIGGG